MPGTDAIELVDLSSLLIDIHDALPIIVGMPRDGRVEIVDASPVADRQWGGQLRGHFVEELVPPEKLPEHRAGVERGPTPGYRGRLRREEWIRADGSREPCWLWVSARRGRFVVAVVLTEAA